MDKLQIRDAVEQDAAALTAVLHAAYANAIARIDGMPDVVGGVADDIAQGHVIVAEIGGNVAGLCVLHLQGAQAKLANIAVDPAQSGHGIGRALMQETEARTRAAGFDSLHLVTHRDMTENVSLYQHLGWQVTETKGQAVLMCKPL